MAFRKRLVLRLTGLFARWGLVKHPYGRAYAREHYTVTGRRNRPTGRGGAGLLGPKARFAVVTALLLLFSVLSAGLLLGP